MSQKMQLHCPPSLVAVMLPLSVSPLPSVMTVVELSAEFWAVPVPHPPPLIAVAVHAPGDRGSVQLKLYKSFRPPTPHWVCPGAVGWGGGGMGESGHATLCKHRGGGGET